ncbi:hypothetical protein PRIC2_011709 [Phytophthora ramorum]
MSTELTFTSDQLSSLSLDGQSDSKEAVYQGTTIVAPPPAPVYRYAIVLKHDKIRFWFEDCDTKRQWYTRELNLEDYVDSTNSIPCARPADYVECFHALMNIATRGEMTDFPIGFYPCEDGTFRLELAVKVQVMHQERIAMYSFDLEPVSVERIDALEGKVRDLQKEVEKLQQKLEARDADDRMEILHAQGTGNLGNTLLWTNVGGATTSFIRIVYPGAYQVVVVVNCELNGSQIKLMKGTECIQLVYCGYADRFHSSTTLTCITRMEKGDQLSVVCTASLVATNRLTLVRLGN